MLNEAYFNEKLAKCVRCGTCKTLCPTYLTTHNESMGARGRMALLGELTKESIVPGKGIAERIFSCMLCGACEGSCPAGINIPEMIYSGRVLLKQKFSRKRFLRWALRHSVNHMDAAFTMLKWAQKVPFAFDAVPKVAPRPFRKKVKLFKKVKKIGRVALFAGCSINYLYPELGEALSNILLAKGYEVVAFNGETCCGAPFRAMGFEDEAKKQAEKNIEHYSRVRAEAVVSMCPTCTMTIRKQFPVLTGRTIPNIMDVNEFILKAGIADGLEIKPSVVTYHDPCHLGYGLKIKDEPRRILHGIKGVELKEMPHADECCGFAGLFRSQYKEISDTIGRNKLNNISIVSPDTVVTSCPGCIMQLEALRKRSDMDFRVMHIVEVIDQAMHG